MQRTADGAGVKNDDGLRPIDPDSLVSMNLWMFTPEFLAGLDDRFAAFRKGIANPLRDEFLLPSIVDDMLRQGDTTVEVLRSEDRWYGVTYREDLPEVVKAIAALHEKGLYSEPLYSDLARE